MKSPWAVPNDPRILEPPAQLAVCTNDEDCQAPVDEHQDTCPVEAQLRATFGF